MIRSALVRVSSKGGRPTTLRQPVQHLYPLEVESRERIVLPVGDQDSLVTSCEDSPMSRTRPRRAAAEEVRSRIMGCVDSWDD